MINDNRIKILILEDDMLIGENLKLTLERLGYEASEPCRSFAEAKGLLESNHAFDLALLDINISGKETGIDVGKMITEKYKFPFIFLTAYSDTDTVASAAAAAPSAYLTKPVSAAALFSAIQTAINNYKSKTVATAENTQILSSVFFVKVGSALCKVTWDEVVSIESSKNYALLNSANAAMPQVPLRGTLTQVLQLVPPQQAQHFIQISRACYVNIQHITQVHKDYVTTVKGEFALGDSYRKQLIGKLNVLG